MMRIYAYLEEAVRVWSCVRLNSFSKFLDMAQEASVQAVLQALQVFSGQPDKASIDAANRWLQDFQHTVSLHCTQAHRWLEPGWYGTDTRAF